MNINNKPLISVISPVYKADTIIEELTKQIKSALKQITENYEIILVNDCSPDNSWNRIVKESENDHRVKGIHLSRNFGQHYSITAGLHYAKGDWMIVMDCDLQDNPNEISNLYNKAIDGWDIVFARRIELKSKLSKRILSSVFYRLYNYFSGLNFDGSIANYGIYHSKVIDEYNRMNEGSRSFPSLVQYLGFNYCSIDVIQSCRFDGESSYTYMKLFQLATDVILSNSNKPLRMMTNIGFAISFFSFLFAFYNLIAYFTGIIKVPGYTTSVFSTWFIGGLILTSIGILGLYVGRIFNEVKSRQLYIVSKVINIEKK
ncbi:MAG: dolichol-phosphate mannosyltransferase [Polaribacter sp.]|jgi:dolichol-phosphate mannosyltransferase|tara:strand:+ start:1119 stop:2066 length:948 start_codon:yes stop_codon:yes gene_type:complete